MVAAALAAPLAPAAGDDWPQWRGPLRNGISAETGFLAGWPEGAAPKPAWRAEVGKGHAAAAVKDGRLFIAGWDGREDTVYCFEAARGALIWKQSYPSRTIFQWPGPRATPTVDGGAVYTLGQWGQLHAWDAANGTKRWSVQLADAYKPDVDYGFAWSPLVEGDLLILGAGRRGLALHKKDGRAAWGDDGQHGACASPVPYEIGGRRGVALITTNPGRDSVALVGVEPRSGAELWRSEPWEEKWGAACVDLLVAGGKVFVTTAEQHRRCARFSIRGGKLEEDWSSNVLSSYTGGCVLVEGHLYGVDKAGILACVEWESGKLKWRRRGFGEFGALMAAGGALLIQTSDGGELVLVKASPDAYHELRRAKVFAGPERTFTVPVLANGRIYCRSYAGELVCLDLSAPAK
jgi:outer membrane protein assembly factor BamB